MSAARWALMATLAASAACARGKTDERADQVDDARARRGPGPDSACEMIVGKMRQCRDAIMMAARTGMVVNGEMPEDAVALSIEISEGFDRNTSDICAVYPESDLVRGTRCFPVAPCEAFAACIIEGAQPAPAATGPHTPTCADGSTAVQAEREGKTTRWCVRADGLPNGPYRLHDGDTLEVEGNYTMGVPHGRWTYHRGGTTAVRIFEEGVVVEMDGQRLDK